MSNSDDFKARFVGSAVGAFIAETITLPTDVVKVRLQVQTSAAGAGPRYSGFADCLVQTAKNEGFPALWKGFTPALIRQVCYTSTSLVIYEPIRECYANLLKGESSDGKPNYAQRLAAGGTAGALAISVFNPAEVVKTQVQTSVTPVSMGEVISRVYAKDGILGFWAGLRPNVTRTFLVNAAELGTYDEAKTRLSPYLGEGFFAHVGASGCAGFVSACVSTPADVVKTRLMNSAGGQQLYSGMLHAGFSILKDEGPAALYKGFLPICVRKLIWCAAFFVSYERIRAAVNAQA
eukprot:TRINITY_DN111484_c0_g1_i1.p1 TRINITY_DN111484_c0_g1~~TRINITY_DN111484_c0_g1_i1.p1  ORF type:complete len:292 (-),score=51.80 TRINITY_DN111484_c0_g1_i1:163-1038(-)